MISEKKLDSSFSIGQFFMTGYYEPNQIDWNSQRTGTMSKRFGVKSSPTKGFSKRKWLFCCPYNPDKTNI